MIGYDIWLMSMEMILLIGGEMNCELWELIAAFKPGNAKYIWRKSRFLRRRISCHCREFKWFLRVTKVWEWWVRWMLDDPLVGTLTKLAQIFNLSFFIFIKVSFVRRGQSYSELVLSYLHNNTYHHRRHHWSLGTEQRVNWRLDLPFVSAGWVKSSWSFHQAHCKWVLFGKVVIDLCQVDLPITQSQNVSSMSECGLEEAADDSGRREALAAMTT